MRISRVIRDFSAEDVLAGNKTSNLRQLVEARAKNGNANIQEIRYREIDSLHIDPSALSMKEYVYSTEVSTEYFLQWVNSENKIAGFLRLSLPKEKAFLRYKNLPTLPTDAMIREVHVYGRTARIHKDSAGAQHLGLGKKLIARAEEIARECGYANIKVISAIGTRTYYKNLGFDLRGLYQEKTLFTE